ncbi:hypothetical protein FA13DRAFT_1638537 [Coprinellus micaceus]|uniref:Fatty acid desaturase domain-containing protein n=1 Tax=Coprinellus micaceus TaxID=71717 RepID=A0A4Y7SRP9_COPMI|nr:hypothetical protein FA13DRAFT_1638537 [Coprinellus micaceus]
MTPRSQDGVEVDEVPTFTPMTWSLKEIRNAIPRELFVRNTRRSLMYLVRDLLMFTFAWSIALQFDVFFQNPAVLLKLTPTGAMICRWGAWMAYWWFQGLIVTGIWVIGHECGHGAFSDHKVLDDALGFVIHTLLWTPYFSWKISHHRHHCNHASMERDEVYVPKTREDLGIPDEPSHKIDWDEVFGDTPIYTLLMLIRQELLAFPAYLLYNVSGQKHYPKHTNHFNPGSILFTKEQRNAVIASNAGIVAMVYAMVSASSIFGFGAVMRFYGIPWLALNHWFTMITYLQHTDIQLPHYREKEWNFQRGAAATADRDFLGWQGRFFLHDVAHYHVIHHFFPKMPFYHGAEATKYLRAFIGDHYVRYDAPVFKALWQTYNNCQFVDNEGDIVFYRDKKGRASRRPHTSK